MSSSDYVEYKIVIRKIAQSRDEMDNVDRKHLVSGHGVRSVNGMMLHRQQHRRSFDCSLTIYNPEKQALLSHLS